ncbi:MAG: alpha/beta hydrolase [Clostridia bacterium]|nr:alpha/beta hydrolase [Clostridia bacterium]
MITEHIKLFPDRKTTLTTYIHEASNEMKHCTVKPAMLVIPGGGYRFCSERESEVVAMKYYTRGYNAFVLRYSIGEDSAFPRPLEDAEKAMETIVSRAEEFMIDPEKIAVAGFSAGGHLAATLGTMGKIKPKAMILAYPCVIEEMLQVLSPQQPSVDDKVDSTTPQTFLVAASNDDLVPVINSIRFAEVLDENKIPFEMHIYSIGGHGFSVAEYSTCGAPQRRAAIEVCQTWVDLSLKWLDRVMN